MPAITDEEWKTNNFKLHHTEKEIKSFYFSRLIRAIVEREIMTLANDIDERTEDKITNLKVAYELRRLVNKKISTNEWRVNILKEVDLNGDL